MTDYKMISQRNFDRQADCYDSSSYGQHARKLYPVLLSQLDQIPHQSILDVGCGTGALLERIISRWPGTSCTGLDLSPKMVTAAREKLGSRAQVIQADAESLPLPDSTFDVVVCNDSFHHYPNPETVLAEISRVMQPGGVFLLGDTTAPAGLRGITNLLLPHSRGGDVRLYSRKELTHLLSLHFQGIRCGKVDATSLLAWGIKAEGQPQKGAPR